MATKKRKYSDEYLQVGFTSITGGVERPQCVIYNKVLGPDSMRPNKLRSHLQKVHPVHADKDASSFQRMERSLKAARLDSKGHFQQQDEAALTASYEI